MPVDPGLIHNPEAAMNPYQVHDFRDLNDPEVLGCGKPLAQYLEEDTDQVAVAGDVEHRNSSNCHYIIDHGQGRVYFAYGFHGYNVFEAVSQRRMEDIWLRLV